MDLKIAAVVILLQVLITFHAEATGGLSYSFYAQSCPHLESIVRARVRSVSLADPTTPAALLRLMFHDCQVQGCDASILLDPDGYTTKYSEMASSKNFGIRKRNTIGLIKATVETICPGQVVSCLDILVLAAREAVALSGGPRIDVPLGRRDSFKPPNFRLADTSLPPANTGAHTLGITHCFSLQGRLHNLRSKNRSGKNTTNPGFLTTLTLRCPMESIMSTSSKINFLENDLTSIIFDNQYFIEAINGRGVLKINSEMPLDSRTKPFVERFASDQDLFFRAFSSAFVKLSSHNVLTRNQGGVRRSCNGLYRLRDISGQKKK